MRFHRLALVVLLAFVPSAMGGIAHADDDADEWERPFHGLLPDPAPDARPDADDGRLWHQTRILDAETGLPVPGAELLWYPERILDWWIEHAFLLGRGVADERGFAFVAANDAMWNGDAHWIADAPGYAPTHDYGVTPPEVMWLKRGRTVTGRALDAHGRPVERVRVDYFKGCGHAPVLRTTTTDDRGLFTLDHVDPDEGLIWIVAPGVEVDYIDIGELFEYGDRVHDLVLPVGWTARGRVVDERGTPIQGAVVRCPQTHRGPATITSRDGTFVLHGVEPRGGLYLHHPASLLPEQGAAPNTEDDHEWVDAIPLTLVLSPRGIPDQPAPDATLRVRITTDGGGQPVGDLSFYAVPLAAGHAVEAYTSSGPEHDDEPVGERTLPVRSGTWQILPFGRFDALTFDAVIVEVRAGAVVDVPIVARARPRLEIRGQPADWQWMLLNAVGEDLNNNVVGTPWQPPVPTDGPLTLWLQSRDESPLALFHAGPMVDGVRTVHVDMPAPHRIGVRDSGQDALHGASLSLVLRGTDLTQHSKERWQEGLLHATTYASGALDLLVHHRDESVQRVPLDLSENGGDTLDVDLAEYPRVSGQAELALIDVRLADESLPAGAKVHQMSHCAEASGDLDGTWSCRPDETLTITTPGYRTIVIRPGKPGRRVVRLGTATIKVNVADTDGDPLSDEAIVWIDDTAYLTKGNVLELGGFDPGPHDVIVMDRNADEDSVGNGKRFRIVLRDGETRVLNVALPY